MEGGGVGGWEGRRETLVDFAEDDDAGEFGLGIAGDDWVVEVYSWDCSMDVSWERMVVGGYACSLGRLLKCRHLGGSL